MKKLLCVSLAIGLGACQGVQPASVVVPTVAATITADVLTPQQLATAKSICGIAAPELGQLVRSANAKVSGTAIYPASYCTQLAAAPAGQVPATTNAGTVDWLSLGIKAAELAATFLL